MSCEKKKQKTNSLALLALGLASSDGATPTPILYIVLQYLDIKSALTLRCVCKRWGTSVSAINPNYLPFRESASSACFAAFGLGCGQVVYFHGSMNYFQLMNYFQQHWSSGTRLDQRFVFQNCCSVDDVLYQGEMFSIKFVARVKSTHLLIKDYEMEKEYVFCSNKLYRRAMEYLSNRLPHARSIKMKRSDLYSSISSLLENVRETIMELKKRDSSESYKIPDHLSHLQSKYVNVLGALESITKNVVYCFTSDIFQFLVDANFDYEKVDRLISNDIFSEVQKKQLQLELLKEKLKKEVETRAEMENALRDIEKTMLQTTTVTSTNPLTKDDIILPNDDEITAGVKLERQKYALRKLLKRCASQIEAFRQSNREIAVKIMLLFPEINEKLHASMLMNSDGDKVRVVQQVLMNDVLNTPERMWVLKMQAGVSAGGLRTILGALSSVASARFDKLVNQSQDAFLSQLYALGSEGKTFGVYRSLFLAVQEKYSYKNNIISMSKQAVKLVAAQEAFNKFLFRAPNYATHVTFVKKEMSQTAFHKPQTCGFLSISTKGIIVRDAFNNEDDRTKRVYEKPVLDFFKDYLDENPAIRQSLSILGFQYKEMTDLKTIHTQLRNVENLRNFLLHKPILENFPIYLNDDPKFLGRLGVSVLFVSLKYHGLDKLVDMHERDSHFHMLFGDISVYFKLDYMNRHLPFFRRDLKKVSPPKNDVLPDIHSLTCLYQFYHFRHHGTIPLPELPEREPDHLDIWKKEDLKLCFLHEGFIYVPGILNMSINYLSAMIHCFALPPDEWLDAHRSFVETDLAKRSLVKVNLMIYDPDTYRYEMTTDERIKSDYNVMKFARAFSNPKYDLVEYLYTLVDKCNAGQTIQAALKESLDSFVEFMGYFLEYKNTQNSNSYFTYFGMVRFLKILGFVKNFALLYNLLFGKTCHHYFLWVLCKVVEQITESLRCIDFKTDINEQMNSKKKTMISEAFMNMVSNWINAYIRLLDEDKSIPLREDVHLYNIVRMLVHLKVGIEKTVVFKKYTGAELGERDLTEDSMMIDFPKPEEERKFEEKLDYEPGIYNPTDAGFAPEEIANMNEIFKHRMKLKRVLFNLKAAFSAFERVKKGGKSLQIANMNMKKRIPTLQGFYPQEVITWFNPTQNAVSLRILRMVYIKKDFGGKMILNIACGAGKTAVWKMVVTFLRDNNKFMSSIFTGPANALGHIVDLSRVYDSKFNLQPLKFYNLNQLDKWLSAEEGVLMVSHSSLHKIDTEDGRLKQKKFSITSDEGHLICNPGKTLDAFSNICKIAALVNVMTATLHPGEDHQYFNILRSIGLQVDNNVSDEDLQKALRDVLIYEPYTRSNVERHDIAIAYELPKRHSKFKAAYMKEKKLEKYDTIDINKPTIPNAYYSKTVNESINNPDMYFEKNEKMSKRMEKQRDRFFDPTTSAQMTKQKIAMNAISQVALNLGKRFDKPRKLIIWIESIEYMMQFKDSIIPMFILTAGRKFKKSKRQMQSVFEDKIVYVYRGGGTSNPKEGKEKYQQSPSDTAKNIHRFKNDDNCLVMFASKCVTQSQDFEVAHVAISLDMNRQGTGIPQRHERMNRPRQKNPWILNIQVFAKNTIEQHLWNKHTLRKRAQIMRKTQSKTITHKEIIQEMDSEERMIDNYDNKPYAEVLEAILLGVEDDDENNLLIVDIKDFFTM